MRRTGFTVVELMVVVAIIGLLATLAIPAYQQMLVQVHRTEAKSTLGSLHNYEKAFFGATDRYGCFDEVGFQLEGQGHFSVWLCDAYSAVGCMGGGDGDPDGDGMTECPCVIFPADWAAPGSSEPGGGVPPDLPASCGDLRSGVSGGPGFEADVHNYCTRPVANVVNVAWVFNDTSEVFTFELEDGLYDTCFAVPDADPPPCDPATDPECLGDVCEPGDPACEGGAGGACEESAGDAEQWGCGD